MQPNEVIQRALIDYELHPLDVDFALNALTEAGFVVVACPPGSRVVVSRESKPCDCPVMSGEGAWREAHDPECASVVEATTIHAVEPGRGEMVWESQGGAEVPRWVETWRAVALPEDGE